MKGADWFHWTGITPALSENAANECKTAIKTANKLGITVSCDITDIVDRVGGGHSFMGGLIFGLLHYADDLKALEFATAACCLKHTLKGITTGLRWMKWNV